MRGREKISSRFVPRADQNNGENTSHPPGGFRLREIIFSKRSPSHSHLNENSIVDYRENVIARRLRSVFHEYGTWKGRKCDRELTFLPRSYSINQ